MAVSTIPAFKDALVDRLVADANLGGAPVPVACTYGVPHTGLAREHLWVGNARPDDTTRGGGRYGGGQTSAAMGAQRREERYVLEVNVRALLDVREPQQAATERAFAIVGHLENSLRAWGQVDPPFGSVGVRWALVTSTSLVEQIDTKSNEREAVVLVDIACSARI